MTWLVVLAGVLTVGAFTLGVLRSSGRRNLVLAASGVIAAYAAFGKVYSPQYIVWTLPLFASALGWRRYGMALTLAVAMVLTLEEYSHLILMAEHSTTWVAVVAVRNLLTIASIAVALREVLRAPTALAGEEGFAAGAAVAA